jgi:hypothetical protein
MDESYIEVYDKYYRSTGTTNESGDFMIFGVPVGTQTIVMGMLIFQILVVFLWVTTRFSTTRTPQLKLKLMGQRLRILQT